MDVLEGAVTPTNRKIGIPNGDDQATELIDTETDTMMSTRTNLGDTGAIDKTRTQVGNT